jgi:hypothetical protein
MTVKIHESITLERVMCAMEASMFGTEDAGFCLGCGEDAMEVEPDAERYQCESCGKRAVYGAEQLLLLGLTPHVFD